jgi:hypothetical protein
MFDDETKILLEKIETIQKPFSSTTMPDFWMMFDTFNLPSVFPPRANSGKVALFSKISTIPS